MRQRHVQRHAEEQRHDPQARLREHRDRNEPGAGRERPRTVTASVDRVEQRERAQRVGRHAVVELDRQVVLEEIPPQRLIEQTLTYTLFADLQVEAAARPPNAGHRG